MFYITGDTHGNFERYTKLKHLTKDDVLIILGDVGLNYYENKTDERHKKYVNSFPFITFCIHGNHEKRPYNIASYTTKQWRGGIVYYEPEFPNILFAKDGEIYDFDGYNCLAIGGAYSVDKEYRLLKGFKWFADEQPSREIKSYIENQITTHNIDIILSHTCPLKYEPIEVFLPFIDQRKVDKSTEEWLDIIESKIQYKRWYCGHYHTSKIIDKIKFMFEDIVILED